MGAGGVVYCWDPAPGAGTGPGSLKTFIHVACGLAGRSENRAGEREVGVVCSP